MTKEIGRIALVNGIAYPVPMDTNSSNVEERLKAQYGLIIICTDTVTFIECIVEDYPGIVMEEITIHKITMKCKCPIEVLTKSGCQCGGE